jgi:hypothetical protein
MLLPENPSLDWLRTQAKHRLEKLREANPAAQLADAQFDLAKRSDTEPLATHVYSGIMA